MKRSYDYNLTFSSMPGHAPHWEGKQTFIHKPFCRLFADAALLAYHSRNEMKETPWAIRNACARSAILASAFSLEAVANCCLGLLNVSGRTLNEIDHLATLGKFDVFLIARGADQMLDRGCKHVQAMTDLIELRNAAVHPKQTTRTRMHSATVTRSGEDIKKTKNLHIPFEHLFWSPDDAELILRSLCDFLNYYLLGLCNLNVSESEAILCTEWHDSKDAIFIAQQEFGNELHSIESEWKLDLRFLHTWKRRTTYEKDGTEIVTLPAYPENKTYQVPQARK